MSRSLSASLALSAIAGLTASADPLPPSFARTAQPVLSSFCTDCHGGKKPKAGLSLSGTPDLDPDKWFRILEQIESGAMPPEDEDQPTAAQRKAVTGWIRGDLSTALLARQKETGRAGFRRLNHGEYANTINDLLGYIPRVLETLPSDGQVDGYNKVAAALPMSSETANGYIELADEMLKPLLRPFPANQNRTIHAAAMESGESPGHTLVLDGGTMVSFNSDTGSGRLNFTHAEIPGLYTLKISAYAFQSDKPLPFGVYVGKTLAYPQEIKLATVLEAPPGGPAVIETQVYLHKGQSVRLIPFGLGVPVPKNTIAAGFKGPGLAVQWVDFIAPEYPLPLDRFLTADLPTALIDEIRRNPQVLIGENRSQPLSSQTTDRPAFLAAFEKNYRRIAPFLLRRDPTEEEMAAVLKTANERIDAKAKVSDIVRDPIFDLLVSPDFLCVVEPAGKLDDFALAGRLARFLWNSTPDAELLQLAREKKLGDPAILAAQTDRLLKDPKSDRFIADFSDQWLGLRAIDDTSPDSKLHPGYDDLLKRSSLSETRLFIRNLIDGNRPIIDLVAPGYSYLNAPLALHYGLPPLAHIDLKKTALPADSPYGGIWTQAAVMKVTANGTNTSPVKRGVWVSDRLLGIHIPPPPPDITPIEPDTRGAKTMREQLALHRNSKSCAACHARFDGYGFALENFDVIGSFRSSYRLIGTDNKAIDGLPVDPSGTTPDGVDFHDVRELRAYLAKSPEKLAAGITRHLVTYATGARPTGLDAPAVDRIVTASAKSGYPLRSLIRELVQSELFRWK